MPDQTPELPAPEPGPSPQVSELLGWLTAGREAIAAFQAIRAVTFAEQAHEAIVTEIRQLYAEFDEKHPQLAKVDRP